jgi:hypothetical protein
VAKQHIIELNGKRYDTASGKRITASPSSEAHIRPVKTTSNKLKNIDGFARPTHARAGRQTLFPAHKVQKSKTLMRGLVKKPSPPKAASAKPSSQPVSMRTTSSQAVPTSRLVRAHTIAKSALVHRFGNDVTLAPKAVAATPGAQRPARLHAKALATVIEANPLARGLARAVSHEEVRLKKPRRHERLARRLRISPRIISGGALMLAVVLVGGFFAYQNIPNLNMRLASARSGVHGSLPGYHPAGFNLNDVVFYKPGEIAISYRSNSDNRNFHIIQSTTAYNSQTLLTDYVAKNYPNSITVSPQGKTVYISGSNATWVDSGVWYRIEGDSNLNSDQLQSIANSL